MNSCAQRGKAAASATRRSVLRGMTLGAAAFSSGLIAGGVAQDDGMQPWSATEADRRFQAEFIEPNLPEKIFDAHAHLFQQRHFTGGIPDYLKGTPKDVGIATYRELVNPLHPNGRLRGGLFFGFAVGGDLEANNAYVTQEVRRSISNGFLARSQMLITPDMPAEHVREQVRRQGFCGLKPYYLFTKPSVRPQDQRIEEYFPADHARIAHEEGLSVTLHIVREGNLADPQNQATIRGYCSSFPNMRLILAHGASGFNPWQVAAGVRSLSGLHNLWCDTSSVTSPATFQILIQALGHRRIVYGTDFFGSNLHINFVPTGDSIGYIDETSASFHQGEKARPVLLGLEQLRSLIFAMQQLKLSDRQIEDIFYGNAAELLGLPNSNG